MTIHSVKEFKTADELRAHYRRVLSRVGSIPSGPVIVRRSAFAKANVGPRCSGNVGSGRDWLNVASTEVVERFPMSSIVDTVCKVTGVSKDAVMSPVRSAWINHARFIIYWIGRKHTMFSATRIAELMGKKDHTTVMNGIRTVEKSLATFQPDIDKVLAVLKADICAK